MTKTQVPPRTVAGLAVVKDEPVLSGLGQPLKFRLLTLADTSTIYGCGECPDSTDFTGTRSDVRTHRIEQHGLNAGGVRARPTIKPATKPITKPTGRAGKTSPAKVVKGGVMAALAQTEPPLGAPAGESIVEPMDPATVDAMTIGELRRFAGQLARLGDLVETLRIENAELERDLRDVQQRAAVAAAVIKRYHAGFRDMGLLLSTADQSMEQALS